MGTRGDYRALGDIKAATLVVREESEILQVFKMRALTEILLWMIWYSATQGSRIYFYDCPVGTVRLKRNVSWLEPLLLDYHCIEEKYKKMCDLRSKEQSKFISTYICMYVRLYVCLYACMSVWLYVFMYECMYVCMYVRRYVCVYWLMWLKYFYLKSNIVPVLMYQCFRVPQNAKL